jgi:hypothetical protein
LKRKLFAGSTSVIERIFIRDTSNTTKVAGLTGITSSSGGLTFYYARAGTGSSVAITLAAGTLGTWSSGGFVAVDATNMPGWYEVGIPNAAIASGAFSVGLSLRGATNMDDIAFQFELDAVNYQSANGFITGVNGVAPPTRWNAMAIDTSGNVTLTAAEHTLIGGTDVPAALTAQGYTAARGPKLDFLTGDAFARLGSPAGASIAADIQTRSTYAGGAVASVTSPVTVGTNSDKTGYSLVTAPPTAAAIATSVWQDATSGDFTTASSIGKSLYNAFTSNTSVFTTPSLANAPTAGGATAAAIATAVWQDSTAGSDFSTSNSIGALLKTYTVAPTVIQVRTEMDSNSTKLANLDATISSRFATAGYTVPPTTSQIATALLTTPANKLATDGSGNVVLSAVTHAGAVIPRVTLTDTTTNVVNLGGLPVNYTDGLARAGSTTTTLLLATTDANYSAAAGSLVGGSYDFITGTGSPRYNAVVLSNTGPSGSPASAVTFAALPFTPDATSGYVFNRPTSASGGGGGGGINLGQFQGELDTRGLTLTTTAMVPLIKAKTDAMIVLASGSLQAGSTVNSIVLSGSSLIPVSGDYTGRPLRYTTGAKQTYQTPPCTLHTVSGSSPNFIHTFAFTVAVNDLPTVNDTVSVI